MHARRCVSRGKTLSYSVAFAGPGISVDLLTSFSKDITDCIYTGKGTVHHHWEWGFGGKYTSKKARVLFSY